MKSIRALSLAPRVNDWLANSRSPRILHVFDQACNLINERRDVLSVVTQRIGNGPFNLVVEDRICFLDCLALESRISISSMELTLGDLIVYTADANLWNPCPDWAMLHARQDEVCNSLAQVSARDPQFPISFASSLAIADLPSALKSAQQLAGLGSGLTPSGDDFMMGAMYAVWILHPPEIAGALAAAIANIAAPLTTSLSAAWLKSAGKGEAGSLWHEFFDALVSASPPLIQETKENILGVGETSGADALAGFAAVFGSWMQKACPSHA